ncbi:class I SAM-dependent DNA methyltransferase [Agitococcus lubricus]
MGRLHDQLKENGYDGHELRVMLIRLLFCLFAEDTQIFNKNQFYNFLVQRTQQDGSDLAAWISQLFDTLNREKRLKNLDEQLNAFAYINGELFKEVIPPAAFDAKMRQELIDACATDWQAISPEIFGALFQSVMNKEERRNLGAHYTSEQNILKMINSLFLQELRDELATIKTHKQVSVRAAKLDVFHDKIAQLTFLDPACGCGNFLVVAYRELRLLELEVIEQIQKDSTQLIMDVSALIRCNVNQFYGIEIEEFPSQIARVAMWLIDHQMNLLVSDRFGMHYARIPLKQSATILNANALQTDWPVTDYILGNPPFIGHQWRSAEQQNDVDLVFPKDKKFGKVDFVGAWFVKAACIMKDAPKTRTAFVSTNSITQGEQVGILWGWIFEQNLCIQFAHRTFQWQSAATGKAAVHCVIIGFGQDNTLKKTIFDYEDGKGLPLPISANNINAYLVDAKNQFLESRRQPICSVPEMVSGNKPIDGGYYFFTENEKSDFIKKEPIAEPYFKRWLGGEEFINNTVCYFLHLADVSPKDLAKMPESKKLIQKVKEYRAASPSLPTQKIADFPTKFHTSFTSTENYLAMPEISSERRVFMPIAFLGKSVLCSNKLRLVADATVFHFGVLNSTMHMAWMRTITGRLKSDYQYSVAIVYNNFPWPLNPSDKQKQTIEAAAQTVLDARAAHPECSLADLYDPLTMPANLLKAHQQLDKAVDAAYGKSKFANEAERVAFLFELYQQYTAPLQPFDKLRASQKSGDDSVASVEPVKPKKIKK